MLTRPALLVWLALACSCDTPAAQTALDVVAPLAVDALTSLVKQRWGSDAEVDVPTANCVKAPESAADWFGDDDRDFEYITCRGKAVE